MRGTARLGLEHVLAEAVTDPDFSVDFIGPCLVGRGLAGAIGNFLLNFSTIFADSVTSFCHA